MISCDTAQGAWGCIAWPARLWLAVLMCCWLLSTGASADAATCTPPVSGLVGWWPGDSNANDIASSNNGVLQPGAMAGAPGLVGLAFSFDGTNGYVQIPDAPALRPTNLTIEGWVRFNSLDSAGSGGSPAGEQYLVFRQNSNSGNFEGFDLGKVRVGASDYFRFQVSSAAGQSVLILSTTVVSVGVWYHVAAVRTPTAIQLFINGQMENQAAVGFAQDYGAFPLYFGTSGQSYWDHKFSGSLDEIALYNRALSASEIAAIYNAGSAGKCRTPSIDSQPQSLALNPGMTAVFTTSATGLAPLSYQWRFNGAVISGATNPSYIITSVQPTNTGQYLVAVSNPFGAVTSAVAVLTVVTGGSGCASAPAGLVGWWAGDGNANDLYSTNNGSLVGALSQMRPGSLGWHSVSTERTVTHKSPIRQRCIPPTSPLKPGCGLPLWTRLAWVARPPGSNTSSSSKTRRHTISRALI